MDMQHDIMRLQVQKTRNAVDLPLPRYMTAGSSGMDLYAAVENEIEIDPGEIALVPTGLMVAVPRGYEIQIRPRSGLAAKYGLGVLNSPGTIDSDYRGEIKVILFNFGKERFCVKRGDRIAQMVLAAVAVIIMEETDQLPPTTRSEGGFGHTGQ